MKERPILFSTLMVKSILTGQKTQTRRVIKPQPICEKFSAFIGGYDNIPKLARFWIPDKSGNNNPLIEDIKCPYDQNLWVRETWQHTKCLNLHPSDENYGYIYKASDNGKEFESNFEEWRWKPSIFMPKDACRIRLEIADVRVERLQDISEDDAKAEGIVQNNIPHEGWYWLEHVYSTNSAVLAFERLWDSINFKRAPWESNPWTWVITFKKQ